MDSLMGNYSDMSFIMNLDAKTFIEIIEKSIKRDNDKLEYKLLHRWGYELPFMEEAIQFEDYKNLALGKGSNTVSGNKATSNNKKKDSLLSGKSNEEIIEIVERVRRANEAKNVGGDN